MKGWVELEDTVVLNPDPSVSNPEVNNLISQEINFDWHKDMIQQDALLI